MRKQTGFTIVELLIVVVVIAILASITIVSYNGITQRANDTVVQSDLKTIAQQLEIYRVTNGVYPVGDAQLSGLGIKVSKGAYGPGFAGLHNMLYCRIAADGPTSFALMAESKSGTIFIYRSDFGTTSSVSAWYSTGSNSNCQAAGINQTIGTDRDLLKYNGAWASWL